MTGKTTTPAADTKSVVNTQQERNITDNVLNRVKEMESKGQLHFPANYSYSNALKSAWLILQNVEDKNHTPVLQSCNQASIANALLDMVIQGLNPVKRQCYFVAYGNKLTLMRSYMGTVAVTRRLAGVRNVYANCIYEGDEFAFELDLTTGLKKVTKHEQKFESIDPAKIKGAYAVVVREDGQNFVEIMNIEQIRKAWAMGSGYGKSATHKDFAEEMAKKTVINRACKLFVNTSDDSDLIIEAFNNSDDEEAPDAGTVLDTVEYEVHEEVKDNANGKKLDIHPEQEKKPAAPKEAATNVDKQGQVTMGGPGF
jgi:recombination protein RecT